VLHATGLDLVPLWALLGRLVFYIFARVAVSARFLDVVSTSAVSTRRGSVVDPGWIWLAARDSISQFGVRVHRPLHLEPIFHEHLLSYGDTGGIFQLSYKNSTCLLGISRVQSSISVLEAQVT
jgi:hypothetical protein